MPDIADKFAEVFRDFLIDGEASSGAYHPEKTLLRDLGAAIAAALAEKAYKAVKITTGSGLSGGGDLSENREIALDAASARETLGLGDIATRDAPTGDIVGTTDTQTLSGKTLSAPIVEGYTEGMVTASGVAFAPNLEAATLFPYTTTGNATITLPAATVKKSFTIFVKYGGAHTITWAGAPRLWLNGEVPEPTSEAGKTDIFSFVCIEAGTWIAVPSGNNF